MLKRFVCLSLMSLALTQCGHHKKRSSSEWVGPKGKVDLDVSRLPPDMFIDGVPVGLLKFTTSGSSTMGLCTAFAIAKNRVMTNHHCIFDADSRSLAKPGELKVYFKNRGDDEQTEVSVASIVDMDVKRDVENEVLYKGENSTDWALLATDHDLTRFKPLDFFTGDLGLDFLKGANTLVMPRVNPPEEFMPPYTAALDPVYAEVLIHELYEPKYVDGLTAAKRKKCKSSLNAFSNHEEWLAAEEKCDKYNATPADVDEVLEKAESYLLKTFIRQGNSGSPVLYMGSVVGIAHAGIFPSENATGDTDIAIAQFFRRVGDRLKQ